MGAISYGWNGGVWSKFGNTQSMAGNAECIQKAGRHRPGALAWPGIRQGQSVDRVILAEQAPVVAGDFQRIAALVDCVKQTPEIVPDRAGGCRGRG